MKYLQALALGLLLGTILRKQVYPIVKAKVEAADLDTVWDIWDTEEWM